jgi:hypothetical protein
MLELRPDSPIDPVLHEILQHAEETTSALGIDFFVGGAMARDILVVHVHGQVLSPTPSTAPWPVPHPPP